jgi:predicted RNase H-like HicB family nuclease
VSIVRVDANLQWNIQQAKSGAWVAICDPLKLTVQADTWADLMEDIGHTLDALLKDLLSSNELDRFLRDQGWKLLAAIPTRPEDVRFDVPFIPAMIANANGSARQLHQ